MKSSCLLTIITSLAFTSLCAADEAHEADRGLEGTLRAAINQRHVHIHVHHGIVTLDGKVPTEADRDRIEAVVRNTSGVAAIKDKLDVSLPTPGSYATIPSRVPVYAAAPPIITPPATVVVPPTPVLVPDYPELTVRPSTVEDEATAHSIARQLRTGVLPSRGLEDVTVSVTSGQVSLKGEVASNQQHEAIIAAVQRARGVTAIYDQMQIIAPDKATF